MELKSVSRRSSNADADKPTVRTVVVGDQAATRANLSQEPFRAGPPASGPGVMTNTVTTSLYTVINFVPLNLWKQFHKYQNVYFLFIAALQCVEEVSITGGLPTMLMPLSMILLFTSFKDAYEDYKRHQADNEENTSTAHRFDPETNEVMDCKWNEIRVGDILEVRSRELLPADLVLLDSSDDNGLCFVMTANLDGETNLKMRKVNADMKTRVAETMQVASACSCELPNNRLANFEGTYVTSGGDDFPLSAENLLLRGTQLRNTDHVKGLVVFTGPETKIQMNAAQPPHKVSSMTQLANMETLAIFSVQCMLCALGGILSVVWTQTDQVKHMSYLWQSDDGGDGPMDAYDSWFALGMIKFGTYILIFTNFIPIAHVLTLEFVKVFQGVLMSTDLACYYQMHDNFGHKHEFPLVAKTSELTEELGMVEYIFSDKTGTLTCNVMEFRKCSVEGVSYGMGTTEIGRAYRRRNNKPIEPDPVPDPADPVTPNVNFVDPAMKVALGDSSQEIYHGVHNFWLSLALNHEVMPEEKNGQIFFSASNPDEAALVYAAQHFGRRFCRRVRRQHEEVGVVVEGEEHTFTILHNLEFSSERKRSSVIVQLEDGSVMLFCKGADSTILARIDPDPEVNAPDLLEQTKEHLVEYVNDGLRTLLVAQRHIPTDEYQAWSAIMHEADVALVDRQEKRYKAMHQIETNMKLVGATAIEDKLQDGVGEAIASLRTGGVKVWMLTGDKVGTAVNIGFSCKLIDQQMTMLRCVAGENPKTAFEEGGVAGTFGLTDLDRSGAPTSENLVQHLQSLIQARATACAEAPSMECCLVVDAKALEGIELSQDPQVNELFVRLSDMVKSVICARVSPKQKARIVAMVKGAVPTAVTLSIGDGANDVPMIQTAHIGVGVHGVEGKQAVNSADFAIGQFRFLKSMLLVHGRWNLRRCCMLTCYLFYKNALLVIPQFFFGFENLMSGQHFYYDFVYQWFNAFFTSLPILVVATFDQDVSAAVSATYPKLYLDGIQRKFLTHKIFWRWMLEGTLHGAFVYYISVSALGFFVVKDDGRVTDIWTLGILVMWLVVLVAQMRLALEVKYWTGYEALAIVLSMLAFMVMGWIFPNAFVDYLVDYGYPNVVFGTLDRVGNAEWFWLLTILVLWMCVLPTFTRQAFMRTFFPDRATIGSEIQRGWLDGAFTASSTEGGARRMSSKKPKSLSQSGEMPGFEMTINTAQDESFAVKNPSLNISKASIPRRPSMGALSETP